MPYLVVLWCGTSRLLAKKCMSYHYSTWHGKSRLPYLCSFSQLLKNVQVYFSLILRNELKLASGWHLFLTQPSEKAKKDPSSTIIFGSHTKEIAGALYNVPGTLPKYLPMRCFAKSKIMPFQRDVNWKGKLTQVSRIFSLVPFLSTITSLQIVAAKKEANYGPEKMVFQCVF